MILLQSFSLTDDHQSRKNQGFGNPNHAKNEKVQQTMVEYVGLDYHR